MFPAALSSKPATMEAQAQGGWSRVAPEVWSSDAQRDSLPSASNFTPGQTGTSSAGGTPRLRTPSGSRLYPLPHSDLAVGLGIREGRAGDSSSGSAGIVCLSAVSLPAVSGPHFLVQEGAQRTCCAGPNPCAVLPGTRVGERDPHVLLFTSTGGGDADARGGGFVETQCPCFTRAAVWEDWSSKARELYIPSATPTPDFRSISLTWFFRIQG